MNIQQCFYFNPERLTVISGLPRRLMAAMTQIRAWLSRLDHHFYLEFSELTLVNATRLPSEYFKRQCWVSIEIEEPRLQQVIPGVSRLLLGNDLPSFDHQHAVLATLDTNDSGWRGFERGCCRKNNDIPPTCVIE